VTICYKNNKLQQIMNAAINICNDAARDFTLISGHIAAFPAAYLNKVGQTPDFTLPNPQIADYTFVLCGGLECTASHCGQVSLLQI
jgi:hypothetical protein